MVDPSTRPLGPGQIRDANRSMLLAAAARAGAEVLDLGVARDTEGHLEGCLAAAIEQRVDVLVTSGGEWFGSGWEMVGKGLASVLGVVGWVVEGIA